MEEQKTKVYLSPILVKIAKLYHLVCCAFALLTLLYFFAFVANIVHFQNFIVLPSMEKNDFLTQVPLRICGNSKINIQIWNCLMWLVFALQHSGMIALSNLLTKICNKYAFIDRSTYVLFSGLAILCITLLIIPDNDLVLPEQHIALKIVGASLTVICLIYFVASIYIYRKTDPYGFFLMKQFEKDGVKLPFTFKTAPITRFGMMQRHPQYSACLMAFIGSSLLNPVTITRLIYNITGFIYVIFGAFNEEKNLIKQLKDYESFRNKVPNMFIPDVRQLFKPVSDKQKEAKKE